MFYYIRVFLKETGICLITGWVITLLIPNFPFSFVWSGSLTWGVCLTFGAWLYHNHPKSKLRIFFWSFEDKNLFGRH